MTSCGVYYDDFLWRSHLNIDSIDKEVCQMSICPKNKSSKGIEKEDIEEEFEKVFPMDLSVFLGGKDERRRV